MQYAFSTCSSAVASATPCAWHDVFSPCLCRDTACITASAARVECYCGTVHQVTIQIATSQQQGTNDVVQNCSSSSDTFMPRFASCMAPYRPSPNRQRWYKRYHYESAAQHACMLHAERDVPRRCSGGAPTRCCAESLHFQTIFLHSIPGGCGRLSGA